MSTIKIPSVHLADPALVLDPAGGLPSPAAAAIAHDEELQVWVALPFEEVAALLRDPAWRKDPAGANPGPYTEVIAAQMPSMLFMDDPDHRRVRGLLSRAFSRRATESLRPRVEEIAGDLLEGMAQRGAPVELIGEFASPLPIIVIAEILGVDPADRADFKRWSDDLALQFNPLLDAEDAARVASSFEAIHGYLGDAVERRRRAPGDDLISALIAVQDEDGERLSDDEMVRVLRLLLAAGNITTTDLIGNGVHLLLRHPDQLAALVADPSLVPQAVEEILRYEPPVVATDRIAPEGATVAGCPVAHGEWVMPVLVTANRDPAAHEDPDRFDIHRPDVRHVSFGGGAHHCLGAPLARLEAQVALARLIERFPRMRLAAPDEPARRRYTPGFQGLAALPVLLEG